MFTYYLSDVETGCENHLPLVLLKTRYEPAFSFY